VSALSGFRREDGRIGVRNLVLNVPVVVCATLVSAEVAQRTGAVTMTHQHGCGHIGDDVEHTESTYVAMATHPNVYESIVFSLGCETLQGPRVERRILESGGRSHIVGIQTSGGAEAATEAGTLVATEAVKRASEARVPVTADEITLGFVLHRRSVRTLALIEQARSAGMKVMLAGSRVPVNEAVAQLGEVTELSYARPALSDVAVWPVDEPSSVAALTLALSGAHAVVMAPDEYQIPTGVPVCPIITLGSGNGLHQILSDDFDLEEAMETETAWTEILQIVNGKSSALESRAQGDIVIPRLRRTM